MPKQCIVNWKNLLNQEDSGIIRVYLNTGLYDQNISIL